MTHTQTVEQTVETPEKPAAPAPAPDFSRPVARPKKGTLKLIGEVLRHGGPGCLQFAITNICNADSHFFVRR